MKDVGMPRNGNDEHSCRENHSDEDEEVENISLVPDYSSCTDAEKEFITVLVANPAIRH